MFNVIYNHVQFKNFVFLLTNSNSQFLGLSLKIISKEKSLKVETLYL